MKSRISFLLALGLVLQSFASLGTLAPAASDAFDAAVAQGSTSLSIFSVSTLPLMIMKEVIRKDIVLCDELNKAAGEKNTGKSRKEKMPAASGLSLTCLESGVKWTGRDIECGGLMPSAAGTAQ
ncbi:MAG: hypothetical protein ACYC5N_00570, partial [Endomicrobiales bacterium]